MVITLQTTCQCILHFSKKEHAQDLTALDCISDHHSPDLQHCFHQCDGLAGAWGTKQHVGQATATTSQQGGYSSLLLSVDRGVAQHHHVGDFGFNLHVCARGKGLGCGCLSMLMCHVHCVRNMALLQLTRLSPPISYAYATQSHVMLFLSEHTTGQQHAVQVCTIGNFGNNTLSHATAYVLLLISCSISILMLPVNTHHMRWQ